MNNDKLIHSNPDISHWLNDPYNHPENYSLTDEELLLQQTRESALARYCIHDEELKQFDFLVRQATDKILVNSFNIQTPSELGLIRDQKWAVRVLFLLKKIIETANQEQSEDLHFEELLAGSFDDPNTYNTLSCGHIKGVMPFFINKTSNLLKTKHPRTISDLANIIASSCLIPIKYFGEFPPGAIVYQEQILTALKQCMGEKCDKIYEVMSYFTVSYILPTESYREIFDTYSIQNGLISSDIRDKWHKLNRTPRPAPSAATAVSTAILFYIVSYLKTQCPKAFYLTLIDCEWESLLPEVLIEMQKVTGIQIQNPDINHSYDTAYINADNELVWPLNFIKTIGEQSAANIITERCINSKFTSMSNFIHRILLCKRNNEVSTGAMNIGRIVSLILAGCFDKVENITFVRQRHRLINRLPKEFGLKVPRLKHYQEQVHTPLFWEIEQANISGIDSLNYYRVYQHYQKAYPIRRRATYISLDEVISAADCKETVLVCAKVIDCAVEPETPLYDSPRRFYAKLKLRQNNCVVDLLVWERDNYCSKVGDLRGTKGKIVILSAKIAHSKSLGVNYLEWQEYSTLRQVESMLYGEKK